MSISNRLALAAALCALALGAVRADGISTSTTSAGAVIAACGATNGQLLYDNAGACAGTATPSVNTITVGPAGATLATGEQALGKITASGTAPGAGYMKFEAVAGTNAGTCKIIVYAGTSTTPVTIVDNVGAGC